MHTTSFPARPQSRVWIIAVAATAAAACVAALAPGLARAESLAGRASGGSALHRAVQGDVRAGTASSAARRAQHLGYLVPHEARYERKKARITRRAEAKQALASPAVSGPLAPTNLRSWLGINSPTNAPPDETSAVGTGRYIELVNSNFAIYNKTGNTPVGQGSLNALVNASSGVDVFDPQIMWDAQTNRFYYAADAVVSDTNNRIAFGWSKTANPTSASDWCKYSVGFGSLFPDYPKLGDSKSFLIVGSNLFNGNPFVGSDIMAISKPGAGSTCPAPPSLDDRVINGGFTPTPANEIDTNATGWVVAIALTNPASSLKLYKVTRGSTGNPVIQTSPTNMTVPSYDVPPNAPQTGSINKLDTADGRNTQAVAAIDSGRGNQFALWTQHTVKGGAGAEVRWYEINPATHALIQSGKATNSSLFEFNGAISPNRQVNGSTKSGGSSMVLNFNTSSSATKPGIRMVSKVGTNAQSGQIVVKSSPGQLSGFDCDATSHFCRWGDYAGATPDPSTANRIWNVSQFAVGSGSSTLGNATSRTWNFVAKP